MAALVRGQQFQSPLGTPFAAQPQSPRGLYRTFGAPESLVAIHFPKSQNPDQSKPWFWFITRQQPQYFSFFFTAWGRFPFFSIIKILQIDPRQPEPTPFVGASTLEAAIAGGNPDATWGRFNFQNDFFWQSVMRNPSTGANLGGPIAKPDFNVIKGLETSRHPGGKVGNVIKSAVKLWETDWNGEAKTYNQIAAGVGADGFHYPGQRSLFSVPLPDGPPTTISHFDQQLGSFQAYLGPVPASAFFNINTLTTQAFAFNYKVAQLNDKQWDMSHFPPTPAKDVLGGTASSVTGDYSGFGATDFPVAGPVLV